MQRRHNIFKRPMPNFAVCFFIYCGALMLYSCCWWTLCFPYPDDRALCSLARMICMLAPSALHMSFWPLHEPGFRSCMYLCCKQGMLLLKVQAVGLKAICLQACCTLPSLVSQDLEGSWCRTFQNRLKQTRRLMRVAWLV